MFAAIRRLFALAYRHHLGGSILILLVVTLTIGAQISDRQSFADGELYDDVMDRWGTPIRQPAPSVLYVESGTVFGSLQPLPLAEQKVKVDAEMNYRKRGLVYFSGFDFHFQSTYAVVNDRGTDIDVAFVFPLTMERAQALLSDLSFTVDGAPEKIDLGEDGGEVGGAGADEPRLLWTGRIPQGETRRLAINYRGRGLDSFTYDPDPKLPVQGLDFQLDISGGDNIDYPPQVIPASERRVAGGGAHLAWRFTTLEAGVPMGAILPSEQSFDRIIATMLRRAWAPLLLFVAALAVLGALYGRPLRFYEVYLLVAVDCFFYVLVAYFAAFMNFYVAFALAAAIAGGLCVGYLTALLGRPVWRYAAGGMSSLLLVPNLAVVLQGYTGLIYTLEILAGLVLLIVLSVTQDVAGLLARLGVTDGAPAAPAPL